MAKQVIRVQSTTAQNASKSISDVARLLTELCYFYPQYTLAEARKLPFPHVELLLKTAYRMKAIEYHTLAQIAAAPHAKKGEYKKLIDRFASEAR